jgi:hypothetical protein
MSSARGTVLGLVRFSCARYQGGPESSPSYWWSARKHARCQQAGDRRLDGKDKRVLAIRGVDFDDGVNLVERLEDRRLHRAPLELSCELLVDGPSFARPSTEKPADDCLVRDDVDRPSPSLDFIPGTTARFWASMSRPSSAATSRRGSSRSSGDG